MKLTVNKKIVEVPVTTYEQKEVPTTVTLELTPQEALYLRVLVGLVDAKGSFKEVGNSIYDALDDQINFLQVVKSRDYLVSGKMNIEFRDGQELPTQATEIFK